MRFQGMESARLHEAHHVLETVTQTLAEADNEEGSTDELRR